jgi:hypothetical protein
MGERFGFFGGEKMPLASGLKPYDGFKIASIISLSHYLFNLSKSIMLCLKIVLRLLISANKGSSYSN